KLQEHLAIGFAHRDKQHTRVHVYVNRIDFNANAYKDSFIGKRSQQAAEKVAKQMGLTTVKEVQQEKLNQIQQVRAEIKRIHDKVMEKDKPKNFDKYINDMAKNGVEVIPSINKQNQLQGFRFEYKGHNLKGSEVHRSMSMGNIAGNMGWDKNVAQKMARENRVKLLGKPVGLSPNLAATIARKVVTIAIKKSIGLGMEI
ncbi:MAG: relaxase/mobilization nuclease domain-containing protein, partial [Arenibacter algicola]